MVNFIATLFNLVVNGISGLYHIIQFLFIGFPLMFLDIISNMPSPFVVVISGTIALLGLALAVKIYSYIKL